MQLFTQGDYRIYTIIMCLQYKQAFKVKSMSQMEKWKNLALWRIFALQKSHTQRDHPHGGSFVLSSIV